MFTRLALIPFLLMLAVSGKDVLADVAISIERIDDTRARVSGTGTIGVYDNSGGRRFLRFLGNPLIGPSPSSLTLHAIANSSVVVAGAPLQDTGTGVNVASVPDHFFLRLTDLPTDGGAFEGSVDVNLNVQAWAPVGTSGRVIWGNNMNDVGSWSIVGMTAIPEPSVIPMLAVLASVIQWRRKRPRDR